MSTSFAQQVLALRSPPPSSLPPSALPPSPPPSPPPPLPTLSCANWCDKWEHANIPWSTKCAWYSRHCSGCRQCQPPAPPSTPWSRCGTALCTAAVWAAPASTFTCGDRIRFLQQSANGTKCVGCPLNEAAACARVAADEFPVACGGCNPDAVVAAQMLRVQSSRFGPPEIPPSPPSVATTNAEDRH